MWLKRCCLNNIRSTWFCFLPWSTVLNHWYCLLESVSLASKIDASMISSRYTFHLRLISTIIWVSICKIIRLIATLMNQVQEVICEFMVLKKVCNRDLRHNIVGFCILGTSMQLYLTPHMTANTVFSHFLSN